MLKSHRWHRWLQFQLTVIQDAYLLISLMANSFQSLSPQPEPRSSRFSISKILRGSDETAEHQDGDNNIHLSDRYHLLTPEADYR
jgi:hypothetical protein